MNSKEHSTLDDQCIPELWDQVRQQMYDKEAKGAYVNFFFKRLGSPEKKGKPDREKLQIREGRVDCNHERVSVFPARA